MLQRTLSVSGGGGGQYTKQEFTNLAYNDTVSLTADFPIKYVLAIIGNNAAGGTGYMMMFFDVSDSAYRYFYRNDSYWNYKANNYSAAISRDIFSMSNNNKTVSYSVQSADFEYKTMIYAFG